MSKRKIAKVEVEEGTRAMPHIVACRAYTTKPPAGEGQQGSDCHDVPDTHWINGHPTPIANPMSGYPQYTKTRTSWGINALGSCVVEVEASDGTIGVYAGAYCFVGACSQGRLNKQTGPEWVELFQREHIDAAVLVPL